MRLKASKHPAMGNEKLLRSRRINGGPTIGALLALGILISWFIIPSAAQPPAVPGAKLEPFTETLPGSVVKIPMIPIPGGTVKIGSQTVPVKPLWMARTETPWEALDVFTASGPPSPPYDQPQFAPAAVAPP